MPGLGAECGGHTELAAHCRTLAGPCAQRDEPYAHCLLQTGDSRRLSRVPNVHNFWSPIPQASSSSLEVFCAPLFWEPTVS
jgi:hypothetical protein